MMRWAVERQAFRRNRSGRSFRADALALLLCALCWLGPGSAAFAQSEGVEADMSAHEIAITSDFTGAEIVVFGAVDGSKQQAATSGYYDVIIVIRGPAQSVIVRKKDRVVGIWVNGSSEAFDVSSFYAVLSTRPLDEIASKYTLRRYGIEFNPKPQNEEGPPPPDAFEEALVRIKGEQALYIEKPFAVAFLGRSLFRGNVTLPTQVAEGKYSAQIYLLQGGKLLGRDDVTLRVQKEGIERILYTLAYERPWLYGLLSVILAAACGLLGWTLFGRTT
jgi:uncharacterized protein (TIGR02186 family)